MNIPPATLLPALVLLALPSCSSDPGIRIVEAKPSEMYELGSRRTDGPQVITRNSSTPRQATRGANRLRLPDMEGLPSNDELESRVPDAPAGGVIARPPAD